MRKRTKVFKKTLRHQAGGLRTNTTSSMFIINMIYIKTILLRTVLFNLFIASVMEIITERHVFMLESYFRSGRIIWEIKHYDIGCCVNEFLLFYPQFQLVPRHNIVKKKLVGFACNHSLTVVLNCFFIVSLFISFLLLC